MVSAKSTSWAQVDEQGRLQLSQEMIAEYGLQPGSRLRIDPGYNSFSMHRPVTHLNKVYIEPTNRCNLECITCMRNHWNVTYGDMSPTTFAHIFNQLGGLQAAPTVLFGGIGEPTYHPALPEMIAQVKAIGCRVEMITNGTLLTADRSAQIINAGLDMMWVSIDGAHAESYADVRLGAHLERVIENMKRFRRLRRPGHR